MSLTIILILLNIVDIYLNKNSAQNEWTRTITFRFQGECAANYATLLLILIHLTATAPTVPKLKTNNIKYE